MRGAAVHNGLVFETVWVFSCHGKVWPMLTT